MNAEDVIKEARDKASEWIEMTPYPTEFMVGVLAQKIVNLNQYIEFLERRIKDECTKTVGINGSTIGIN